jgi:hypothetical protein
MKKKINLNLNAAKISLNYQCNIGLGTKNYNTFR